MEYRWLGKLNKNKYSITSIRYSDLLPIKNWRNDQMNVLRQQKPLSDEDQFNYYNQVILPSMTMDEPKILLISYLLEDVCIGYGGLTNIDWMSRRAEISFLLNTERINNSEQYQHDFSAFLNLLKKLTFEVLDFNRLFTETYDIRPLHIATLEANGFCLEGRMKQHIMIDGKYYDSLIHGFLKEYYNAKR